MEAQGNLNEEQLDDGQAAEVLADLNGNDIENQAPINRIDDYMRMWETLKLLWNIFGLLLLFVVCLFDN